MSTHIQSPGLDFADGDAVHLALGVVIPFEAKMSDTIPIQSGVGSPRVNQEKKLLLTDSNIDSEVAHIQAFEGHRHVSLLLQQRRQTGDRSVWSLARRLVGVGCRRDLGWDVHED